MKKQANKFFSFFFLVVLSLILTQALLVLTGCSSEGSWDTISRQEDERDRIKNAESNVAVALSYAGTGSISEAGETETVKAGLSQASELETVIQLKPGGTAREAADYTISSQTIRIPAGELSGSIVITTIDNSINDNEKIISLAIDSVQNGKKSSQGDINISIWDDEPVSHYEFEGCLKDKMNKNHGTANGNSGDLTFSSGMVGAQGVRANGDWDTWVDFGADASLDLASQTVAFWAKPEGVCALLRKGSFGTKGFEAALHHANGFQFIHQTDGIYAGVPANDLLNEWHHYAWALDLSKGTHGELCLYIDGELKNKQELKAPYETNPGEQMRLGGDAPCTFDDLRLYSGVLNQADIRALAARVPQVHLRFENNLADSSPYQRTVTGSGCIKYTESSLGMYALDLNGTTRYLDLGTGDLGTAAEFTLSTWVNLTYDKDNPNMVIACKYASSNGWSLETRNHRMGIAVQDGTTHGQCFVNADIGTGKWSHLVMVVKNNLATVYVNNKLITKDYKMLTNGHGNNRDNNFYIGRSYLGGSKFNGQIDDFRYYSYALSAAEVDTLHKVAPVSNWKLTADASDEMGRHHGDDTGHEPVYSAEGAAFTEANGDFIVVPGSSGFIGDQWSVSYRVKAVGPAYFFLGRGYGQNNGWVTSLQQQFAMEYYEFGVERWTNFGTWMELPLGQWYNMVLMYNRSLGDFGGFELYIDGVYKATDTCTFEMVQENNMELYIGSKNVWDRFDGSMGDVRFYNRILGADEIAELNK
ncbi:MAG: LamG domain-containing protein [bacterium]|nr:LamG domain-containing protein [bacterium]